MLFLLRHLLSWIGHGCVDYPVRLDIEQNTLSPETSIIIMCPCFIKEFYALHKRFTKTKTDAGAQLNLPFQTQFCKHTNSIKMFLACRRTRC